MSKVNFLSKLKFGLKAMGEMSPLTESMNKMLKILEPITFPMAISLFCFEAATMEVTNSGSEVPAATMVSAMIFSEIPKS